MAQLILITGGARSGKSACAESFIGDEPAVPVTYVATAEALDEEMAERIRRHRARRPARWRTVEAPRDADRRLADLAAEPGWIILDCLTLFLANILDDSDDEAILDRVDAMAETAAGGRADTIVVTNEVGAGIVPANPTARRFRDLAGLANQTVARRATEVYVTVVGIAQRLK